MGDDAGQSGRRGAQAAVQMHREHYEYLGKPAGDGASGREHSGARSGQQVISQDRTLLETKRGAGED